MGKWKTVLKSDQSKIEILFGKPGYIPQTYEERDPLVYYWGNIRSHPDDVQTRSGNKQRRWILKLDSAEACLMGAATAKALCPRHIQEQSGRTVQVQQF